MSSILTADDLRPEQTVLRITIIEDDCDDSEFLKEAFQELSPHHRIHCFKTADAFFSATSVFLEKSTGIITVLKEKDMLPF